MDLTFQERLRVYAASGIPMTIDAEGMKNLAKLLDSVEEMQEIMTLQTSIIEAQTKGLLFQKWAISALQLSLLASFAFILI